MEVKTVIEFKFDLFGDYKKQFADYVNYVCRLGKDKSVEERKELIIQLTDAYVNAIGEKPDGKELEKLGTLLLLEHYKSTKPNKKDEDNPVLSTKQVLNRKLNERRIHDGM